MYSYQDRLRAVRLFIKLGKRVGLTIRHLGYPTKNALKSWLREFEQRHDLPTGVDALRSTCALTDLLREVGLPRSSYFYHRARLGVADKYAEVRRVMTDIFERNYRCYGYRRMHASLTKQSVNISEKVVRRLMKQQSLVPIARARQTRSGSPTSPSSRSRPARCTSPP